MRLLSKLLVAAAVPFIGTCCPTLWLQVEKDSPAPWPSVASQPVEQTPFAIPPGSPNRFDVLECGKPMTAAPGYTDAPGAPPDSNGAVARAISDLMWIEHRYQRSNSPACAVHATLVCADQTSEGLSAKCHVLRLDTKVGQAAAVVVRGVDVAVLHPPTVGAPQDMLDLAADVPGTHGESVSICIEPVLGLTRHTLLSFIHMSDIQLRDPSVTLTDRRLSHSLDWFDALSSFEYDEDLAYYNQYVTEAVFATINAIVGSSDDAPKFVIHTGDSIDSGVTSELLRFHSLIDRLQIPFFELFGNHDVLTFGNLTPTLTHDSDQTCTDVSSLLDSKSAAVPHKLCVDQWISCPSCIGNEGLLVAKTTGEKTRAHFIRYLAHQRSNEPAELPGPTDAYCANTAPKVLLSPQTNDHGFDLGTANDSLDGKPLGYYAFAVPLEHSDRRAVFIGLNSEDLHDAEGGTTGRLGHAQVAWLERVLQCVASHKSGDLVFVFAHQPLSEIQVDRQDQYRPDPKQSVAKILEASPNVVAYMRGHNHWHTICNDGRQGVCSHFWEIETASLIEFPQEGRIVRIKQISDDLAFLELTALRERLVSQDTQLARFVTLGRKGAERDFCYTKRENASVRCSADQRPYRTDGRDANARLFFRLPPVGDPAPARVTATHGCSSGGQDPRLQRAIDTIGRREAVLRRVLGPPDLERPGADPQHKELLYRDAELVVDVLAPGGSGTDTVVSVETAAAYDRPVFGIRHGEALTEVEDLWGQRPPIASRSVSHVTYAANIASSSGGMISVDVFYSESGGVTNVRFYATP